jgi:dipeptidase
MDGKIKKGLVVIFIFSLLTSLPNLSFQRKEEKSLDQCTTIVADGSATLDDRVLIAKNKDLGANDCQILDMKKREKHPPNSKVRCEYIEIPQAPITYGWIGMKLPSQWGVGMGVNEFGVVITINAVQSKERFEGEGGLSTPDVCRLGLERSRNSREAVELLGNLIEEYGQRVEGEPTITGQIYIIADPEESWILESAVYHWCAIKVNGVEARANQFQITTNWDLGSKDLVDYAIKQDWCKSKEEFNFARCYSAEGYPFAFSQRRMERGLELLELSLERFAQRI